MGLRTGFVGLLAGLVSAGCSAPGDFRDSGTPPEEEISESEAALSTGIQYLYDYNRVYYDDSIPGVHTAITVCKTTTARRTQVVECPAHFGYALVGGGFKVLPQNGQVTPLVTESYPANPYFWHVRSQDHKGGQSTHHLEVWTVGIMLEGASIDYLRKNYLSTFSQNANALSQTVTFPDNLLFSGGFFMNPGTFGTVSRGNGSNGWTVTARKAQSFYSDFTRLYARLGSKSIIQDFGALEVQQMVGAAFGTGTGWWYVWSGLSAAPGALVGWGGDSQTSTGAGRLLSAVGPVAGWTPEARTSGVESIDPWGASTGTLAEYHTEARKAPNSHGLCTTGPALSSSMDSCVASICAQDPFCCNNTWDGICIVEVTSICGQSCESFTCSTPAFYPNWWSTEPAFGSNCYAYAVNTTSGYMPGLSHFWYPGYTADEMSRALIGTGLLPSTKEEPCPNGRTKIALAITENASDYHFYRQDFGSLWSHKFQDGLPRQTDDNGWTITDPELAFVWGPGAPYIVQGYFCACSGHEQGTGKHVITEPAGEEWPYPFPWEVPP